MNDSDKHACDILIVGAGPAGLACAIAAQRAGLSHLVIDKGSVVDAIRRFPAGMTFFSTADLLEIGGMPFLSSGFRPTRVEALKYYGSVTRSLGLTVRTNVCVERIERVRAGFLTHTTAGIFRSKTVVMATGYFDSPNPYPVRGPSAERVLRRYTEPYEYVGRKVAIVGGRNSAVEMALELFRSGAEVTLIHRGQALSDGVKYWMLPDIQNRIRAGQIKAFFGTVVSEVRTGSLLLEGENSGEIENDVLFAMTGYRPDTSLLQAAGVHIDEKSLIPQHNPETYETNIQGLYVAGSLVAGIFNNKIFIENGKLHGDRIAASILKK